MFVESGLGVRMKFDLTNTVYLTVTAEHLAATRGLCGVYNNDALGKQTTTDTHTPYFPQSGTDFHSLHVSNLQYLYLGAPDDFTTMGGAVSQYAASFGNSWKVPDQHNEVIHRIVNNYIIPFIYLCSLNTH